MSESIHGWFGLTYANYLVLPRSVLQSMPEDWQDTFTDCLKQLRKEFGYLDWPHYDVRALAREPRLISRQWCEHCDGEGEDANGVDCGYCDGKGYTVEDRYETAEEVGIRTDPIPHYNRGRTKIEPKGRKA